MEPADGAGVAALFLEQRDVADGAPGGEPGVALGHAALDELLRQLLDVKRQLSCELVIDGVAPKQRAPTLARHPQESPGHVYARCRSNPTADDSRFHDSSSRVS